MIALLANLLNLGLKKFAQFTIQLFSGVVWFGSGVLFGSILVAALSLAKASSHLTPVTPGSPFKAAITDDTVLHDKMSEINKSKSPLPNIDYSIKNLARIQSRFQEKLPQYQSIQTQKNFKKKKLQSVSSISKKQKNQF